MRADFVKEISVMGNDYDRIVKIDYGNDQIEKLKYDSWGKLVESTKNNRTLSLGKNAGKTHDHGTAFRMHLKDLLELYGEVRTFE